MRPETNAALMSARYVPDAFNTQRIFLIGLPGSGKSTLGHALANALNWPFLDLDSVIEKTTGRAIPAIFQADGETTFRQLEAQILRQVGLATPLVLATGGGTPCFHESMDWLLAHGHVVWLDTPPATIARRLSQETSDRPLLAMAIQDTPEATVEALTELLRQTLARRIPFYSRAPWRLPETETEPVGAIRRLLAL